MKIFFLKLFLHFQHHNYINKTSQTYSYHKVASSSVIRGIKDKLSYNLNLVNNVELEHSLNGVVGGGGMQAITDTAHTSSKVKLELVTRLPVNIHLNFNFITSRSLVCNGLVNND